MKILKFKMKIPITLFLFLSFAHYSASVQNTAKLSEPSKLTKVARISNSVTYGAGISDRENNSYPSQLPRMLGIVYLVTNFGGNVATILKIGHNPFYKTNETELSEKEFPVFAEKRVILTLPRKQKSNTKLSHVPYAWKGYSTANLINIPVYPPRALI